MHNTQSEAGYEKVINEFKTTDTNLQNGALKQSSYEKQVM